MQNKGRSGVEAWGAAPRRIDRGQAKPDRWVSGFLIKNFQFWKIHSLSIPALRPLRTVPRHRHPRPGGGSEERLNVNTMKLNCTTFK